MNHQLTNITSQCKVCIDLVIFSKKNQQMWASISHDLFATFAIVCSEIASLYSAGNASLPNFHVQLSWPKQTDILKR